MIVDHSKKLKLTQEQLDEISAFQKNEVLKTISTPGWEIIENAIRMTKYNAEKLRRQRLMMDTEGSVALYSAGVVDGAEMTRDNIFSLIAQSVSAAEQAEAIEKIREDYNA